MDIKPDKCKATLSKYVRVDIKGIYNEIDTNNPFSLPQGEITYDFANTWDFLKYSQTKDGSTIRETNELLCILAHPENEVKSLDDHITRMKMALLENC